MNQQYRKSKNSTQLKWAILFLTNIILGISSFAQKSTGINNPTPSTKAALHVSTSTTNKQGIIVPELLVVDTLSMAPTASDRGLFFYDHTNARFMYFDGAKWRAWKGNTLGTTPSIGLPNKVAFWNAASDFTANNLFHWDNTNNRLGIGTASPAYPLHVQGDIYARPGILGSSPYQGTSWFSIQHSSLPLDDKSYGFLQSKSGYVSLNTPVTDGTSFIDFRVGDTPMMRITEDGNVGIGTVSPGLEADKTKKYLTMLNSAGPATFEMVSTSSTKPLAMTYMDFYNVLSGTPELIGRIRNAMVTNGSGTMSFFTADGGVMNQNLTINYDRSITIGSLAGVGTALIQTDANGNLSRYTGTSLAGAGVANKVAFWNGANTLTSNTNFHWDNTNGRLGIGTVTPLNALHINAPSNVGDVSLRIQADADDNNENDNPFIEMYQDNLATKAYIGLEAEAGTYAIGTLKNALLLDGTSTSVGGVQLLSNGNVGLTVNNLGNVGIGTSDPLYPLQVSTTTGLRAGQFTNSGTTGSIYGVYANAPEVGTGNRYGVYAAGWYGDGSNYGIYAYGYGGTNAYGIYAQAGGGTNSYAGYFAGNVRVTGEIQRTTTTDANLVPIAYGNITTSGSINSGSGNFTVVQGDDGLYGYFDITITGETYNTTGYTTLVQPIVAINATASRVQVTASAGKLRIYCFSIVAGVQNFYTPFHFVVYQP